MESTKTNKELLLLLKNGDKVAFYNIYERFCKKLYGFVFNYIKQEADTEEIVQEVFVKIWESRDRIDVNASFEAFIFTVAYNTTMSLFRKRIREKKYIEYLKSIQQTETDTDAGTENTFNELNKQVEVLLNELTPRQKEIFLLSRTEGLTHDEIARKLNISVNTVKKHMVNTLAFLRSNIDMSMVVNVLFFHLFL